VTTCNRSARTADQYAWNAGSRQSICCINMQLHECTIHLIDKEHMIESISWFSTVAWLPQQIIKLGMCTVIMRSKLVMLWCKLVMLWLTHQHRCVGALLLRLLRVTSWCVIACSVCPTGVTTASMASTSIQDCNSKYMQVRCTLK
jgi:hypothetical protein